MHGTGTLGITLRGIVAVICLFIGIWGVFPTFTGRFHSGCLTMMLVGALGVASCIMFPELAIFCCRFWQRGIGKTVLCTVAALVAVVVLLFVGVSICMVVACHTPPSGEATVIVLGAALRGNQPSLSLRQRLDAAYVHLADNPDAKCIVSGGQGPDEICTEASVMYAYLVDKGIDPARIYTEESSTSTFENVRLSREVIEQHGLNTEVAVVTQEFHQFRAQQFVKQAGLTVSGAVTAHTPWYLLASYWIRDFAGICHMALLGT